MPYGRGYGKDDMKGSYRGGPAAVKALRGLTARKRKKKDEYDDDSDMEYEEKDEKYKRLMKKMRR